MVDLIQLFTEKEAKNILKYWLKDRHAWITHYLSQSYWEYSDRPFWAITVNVLSHPQSSSLWGHYGFHVYQDGEVKLISKEIG